MEDDTYKKMTAQADAYAMEIKAAFKEKGIPEFVDSYTNQQFVIVTDEQAEQLAKEYTFEQERTLEDGRKSRAVLHQLGDYGSGERSVDRRYPGIIRLRAQICSGISEVTSRNLTGTAL